jgi:hypothetical protein
MHRSRLGVIVIDCKATELSGAAAFWGGALGKPVEIDEGGKYAVVGSEDDRPLVLLQAVDHDSRVHVDIETDDKDAEAARLTALGAKEVARIKGWIVMEAPTGHRFCLVKPQNDSFPDGAAAWGEE